MSQVRIIAGAHRRRLLKFPPALGLRPTPDRVRETLFNWLGQDLTGLCCLDLFAGSGALGFEAASRGAARVVLVERDAKVVRALRENVAMLGCKNVEVVGGDALQCAASWQQQIAAAASCGENAGKNPAFDVVFLDPPYRLDWLPRIMPRVAGLLAEEGVVYAEAEYPIVAEKGWEILRQGRAGQVHYHLMAYHPENQEKPGVAP